MPVVDLMLGMNHIVSHVLPQMLHVIHKVRPEDAMDLTNLGALAASVEHGGIYHFLLHGVGNEADFPKVRLLHSDTGEVETSTYTHLWHPAFTPDGRWVLLQRPNTFGGDIALWIRPLDPAGSQ